MSPHEHQEQEREEELALADKEEVPEARQDDWGAADDSGGSRPPDSHDQVSEADDQPIEHGDDSLPEGSAKDWAGEADAPEPSDDASQAAQAEASPDDHRRHDVRDDAAVTDRRAAGSNSDAPGVWTSESADPQDRVGDRQPEESELDQSGVGEDPRRVEATESFQSPRETEPDLEAKATGNAPDRRESHDKLTEDDVPRMDSDAGSPEEASDPLRTEGAGVEADLEQQAKNRSTDLDRAREEQETEEQDQAAEGGAGGEPNHQQAQEQAGGQAEFDRSVEVRADELTNDGTTAGAADATRRSTDQWEPQREEAPEYLQEVSRGAWPSEEVGETTNDNTSAQTIAEARQTSEEVGDTTNDNTSEQTTAEARQAGEEVGDTTNDNTSEQTTAGSRQTGEEFGETTTGERKEVPQKATDVLDHIDRMGDRPPGHRGGDDYNNDGRDEGEVLPDQDANGKRVDYREWDVNPYRKRPNRGSERLVTGSDGSAYYTDDHYNTFTRVR